MTSSYYDSMTREECILRLGQSLTTKGMFFATAESCTGGLVAEECTNISGSSAWFVGGVVAYANHVKQDVLGVAADTLMEYGAVSEAVVLAMAEGVCRIMNAQCSVAISGVAGPTGGTPEKPVGTVWIACTIMHGGNQHSSKAQCFHFQGSRDDVRKAASRASLVMALGMLENV